MKLPYRGGIVSPSPVTFDEFARFLKTENYFRSEFWDRLAGPALPGGDEVLRRIEFRWDRRQDPIVGVSWYEADAYCRYAGGRLPWRQELLAMFQQRPSRGGPPEWCGDWYNPIVDGPNVLPDSSRSRRIEGWTDFDHADPTMIGGPIAFRVAHERLRSRI